MQRRLVKSPPELWAEVSDLEALSRHLDLFGDIRISRLDPESTVAWEGDRASGTVVLDPAGWGTRVTLTAAMRKPAVPEPAAPGTPAREVDGSAPQARPQDGETGDTTPVVAMEQAGGPAVTPPAAARTRPEPSAAGSEGRGFFARLFRRRPPEPHPQPDPEPAAVEIAPPPPPAVPEPEAEIAAVEPAADPPLDPADAETALEHVLDTLGAAHHRPFSR